MSSTGTLAHRDGRALGQVKAALKVTAFVILCKEAPWHSARLLALTEDEKQYYAWGTLQGARNYAMETFGADGEGKSWVICSLDDLWAFGEATYRLVDKQV